MLSRIAHELYWLGQNLARAEFTARAVEAVFAAELQGTSEAMPSVSFGSGGLLAMLGHLDRERPPYGPEALASLTLDADQPGSMLASFDRAREGARTVRDVISAEITASSVQRLATIESPPITSSDTCGNFPVGCSFPKTLKKCPLIAAA